MPDESVHPETFWTSFGPYACSRILGTVRFHATPLSLDANGFAILARLIEGKGGPVQAAELLAALRPAGAPNTARLWGFVAALNQALHALAHDAGHVAHHPAAGFSLVVPAVAPAGPRTPAAVSQRLHRPPSVRRRGPVFGRDDAIAHVASQVDARRFVTIVGPGGMGKTTVALAAAEALGGRYADGICFVDLAPLNEGRLVQGAVAAALGLKVSGDEIDLPAHLRARHVLIILDSCEHLAAAAAALAESIFSEAARAHVLATSREALRAVGEWVYRLGPMPLPALADDITAAAAGGFPGIQLFVQRARAALPGFELSDALAPAVVGICRRLDGIPLAIELAAARVALLGVRGLATQVQDRLHLLGGLRRDGPRRHRTIETLLDWSYHLLSTAEQVVLRRLSVFRGSFTLGSATFVAADGEAQRALVTEALLDLVTKSLVSGVEHGEATEYRLLETTRAYAAAKLLADPDQVETRRRHALHMRALLLEADVAWERMTRQEWRTAYTRWVDDVRAALDWAFSSEQGEALGLELTSLSLTLADQTSLMTDFAERAFRALEVLRRTPDPPPILAMRLGTLPAYLSAHQNAHLQALARTQDFLGALDLAEGIGEPKYQAGPLTALWVNEFQHGRYSHAMRWSQRLHEVAGDSKDPILALIAKRTAAQTHHFLGQHDAARRLAEDVLGSSALRIPLAYFPSAVDLRVSMRIVLARVLWMQGRAESAADMVEECLQFAQSDTPPASCQALALAAVPVAMWCGDWTLAGRRLDQLRDHLEAYPFAYWQPWYEAFAAVHERQENDGEPSPRPDSVSAPVSDMLGDHLPTFDARTLSGTTLARVRAGEAGWCAPEVLGAHAETLRRGGSVLASEAAKLFREALAIARAQGALAWELRAAMRLATLWKDEGRARSAHALLSTVRRRFVETRMGTDLITADSLLRELARAPGSR